MITAPQNNDYKPGTWKGLLIGKRQRRSASFTCPNGHVCSLSKYEILADGSVHPSVICSMDGCGFHEFITLEGWAAFPPAPPLEEASEGQKTEKQLL